MQIGNNNKILIDIFYTDYSFPHVLPELIICTHGHDSVPSHR